MFARAFLLKSAWPYATVRDLQLSHDGSPTSLLKLRVTTFVQSPVRLLICNGHVFTNPLGRTVGIAVIEMFASHVCASFKIQPRRVEVFGVRQISPTLPPCNSSAIFAFHRAPLWISSSDIHGSMALITKGSQSRRAKATALLCGFDQLRKTFILSSRNAIHTTRTRYRECLSAESLKKLALSGTILGDLDRHCLCPRLLVMWLCSRHSAD